MIYILSKFQSSDNTMSGKIKIRQNKSTHEWCRWWVHYLINECYLVRNCSEIRESFSLFLRKPTQTKKRNNGANCEFRIDRRLDFHPKLVCLTLSRPFAIMHFVRNERIENIIESMSVSRDKHSSKFHSGVKERTIEFVGRNEYRNPWPFSRATQIHLNWNRRHFQMRKTKSNDQLMDDEISVRKPNEPLAAISFDFAWNSIARRDWQAEKTKWNPVRLECAIWCVYKIDSLRDKKPFTKTLDSLAFVSPFCAHCCSFCVELLTDACNIFLASGTMSLVYKSKQKSNRKIIFSKLFFVSSAWLLMFDAEMRLV